MDMHEYSTVEVSRFGQQRKRFSEKFERTESMHEGNAEAIEIRLLPGSSEGFEKDGAGTGKSWVGGMKRGLLFVLATRAVFMVGGGDVCIFRRPVLGRINSDLRK